jgi:hypothetical protein
VTLSTAIHVDDAADSVTIDTCDFTGMDSPVLDAPNYAGVVMKDIKLMQCSSRSSRTAINLPIGFSLDSVQFEDCLFVTRRNLTIQEDPVVLAFTADIGEEQFDVTNAEISGSKGQMLRILFVLTPNAMETTALMTNAALLSQVQESARIVVGPLQESTISVGDSIPLSTTQWWDESTSTFKGFDESDAPGEVYVYLVVFDGKGAATVASVEGETLSQGGPIEMVGIMKASSEYDQQRFIVEHAFDGTLGITHLYCGRQNSGSEWISIRLPTLHTLTAYKLWGRPDGSGRNDPKNYRLQGSNDGARWIDLHPGSSPPPILPALSQVVPIENYEGLEIILENKPKPFLYYRLFNIYPKTQYVTCVGELQLYGKETGIPYKRFVPTGYDTQFANVFDDDSSTYLQTGQQTFAVAVDEPVYKVVMRVGSHSGNNQNGMKSGKGTLHAYAPPSLGRNSNMYLNGQAIWTDIIPQATYSGIPSYISEATIIVPQGFRPSDGNLLVNYDWGTGGPHYIYGIEIYTLDSSRFPTPVKRYFAPPSWDKMALFNNPGFSVSRNPAYSDYAMNFRNAPYAPAFHHFDMISTREFTIFFEFQLYGDAFVQVLPGAFSATIRTGVMKKEGDKITYKMIDGYSTSGTPLELSSRRVKYFLRYSGTSDLVLDILDASTNEYLVEHQVWTNSAGDPFKDATSFNLGYGGDGVIYDYAFFDEALSDAFVGKFAKMG